MLPMNLFGKQLDKLGYNFYSGVPCSFLKSLINYAINKEQFIMSANEGDAVATCAGAYLGGKKTVFLCQNSGLTNAVSPLTSLNYTFQIPVLGFVSLRGEENIQDEPQHELMGRITDKLLHTMEIEYEVLSNNINNAKQQLIKADHYIEKGKSFFFIVKKGTFDQEKLHPQKEKEKTNASIRFSNSVKKYPRRIEALDQIKNVINSDTLLLATTGVTGRELYEIEDSRNQLYMVGSMGCVSSLALGLALVRPDKKIIAIDGDGSLLMRMGSLATIAYYSPNNLYHLLLDNGMHESTGGQKTVSENVNFLKIAEGASYEQVIELNNLDDLENSVRNWRLKPNLTFAYLETKKGIKEKLGRPKIKPFEVKERFIKYIGGHS